MKLGIIDIGSNSIRLVVMDVHDQAYLITDQIKHSARLGQDMTPDGYLNEERINYALKVLTHFSNFMRKKGVAEVICVATEAIRRAKNQSQFLSKARVALGSEIRVLSGLEEAYYDYLGCVNTLDVKSALAFDIGGSSTELILIKNRYLEESISTRLGSISLMEMFDLGADPSPEAIEHVKAFILDQFSRIPWLRQGKKLPLIGIGGSVRTMGKIDRLRKGQSQFIAHNYSMDRSDIDEVVNLNLNYKIGTGPRPKGLARDRDDIFTGSLILIETLADYLNSEKIFVSGAGVRDGLLFEYLFGAKTFVPDVLEFSLRNVIKNHMSSDYDGEELWSVAETIFDLLATSNSDLRNMKKVMKTTTYLHDIGKSINFFQRDRNTFYSILNAPIHGISQKQILLAASSATMSSTDDILKEFLGNQLLNQRDIRVIRKLGLILKLSQAIVYSSLSDGILENMTLTKSKLVIPMASMNEIMFAKEKFSYNQSEFRRTFGVYPDFIEVSKDEECTPST